MQIFSYEFDDDEVKRRYSEVSNYDFMMICDLLAIYRGRVWKSFADDYTITMQTYSYPEKCETKIIYNMRTQTMTIHWRYREFGQ